MVEVNGRSPRQLPLRGKAKLAGHLHYIELYHKTSVHKYFLPTMALPSRYCPSCLASIRSTTTSSTNFALRSPAIFRFQSPFQQHQQKRNANQSANALKYRRKDQPASQKKKKARTTYLQPDLKKAIQFSLVDAMRYIHTYQTGTIAAMEY